MLCVAFSQRSDFIIRVLFDCPIFAALAQSAHTRIRAQTRGKDCTTRRGSWSGDKLSLFSFALHQDLKSHQVFGFRSRGARLRGDFGLGASAFVSIRCAGCCAVDDDTAARLRLLPKAHQKWKATPMPQPRATQKNHQTFGRRMPAAVPPPHRRTDGRLRHVLSGR